MSFAFGCLVASTQQYDERLAVDQVVDAIARADIDLQLAHAMPEVANLSWIAERQAHDPHLDAIASLVIAQALNPLPISLAFEYLEH